MMEQERLQRVVDEHEIGRVLSEWGFARDHGDWASLANCFQPDATIHISWFSGPAAAFIERSKVMLAEFKEGEHGKHQIGRALIRVNGGRATSVCQVELIRRVRQGPFDFDTITWGRFHDRFEKRDDGVWRIHRRTMVYEKDRLDPVNPADVPEGYFERIDLSQYPPACQYLCYRLGLTGLEPMPDLVQDKSAAAEALTPEAAEWLTGACAP